jgi:hypothetical protein
MLLAAGTVAVLVVAWVWVVLAGSGRPLAGPAAAAGAWTVPSTPVDSASTAAASPTASVAPSPSLPPSARPGAAAAQPVAPAGHRIFTLANATSQTVWGAAQGKPALPHTGWVIAPGGHVDIVVPDAWNGRLWGRTGCSFDGAGRGHCATGDCGGKLECGGATGALPATLAEYNLNSYAGLDFYDVSLVDGSNLPMWINITKGDTKDTINSNGCSAAGCTKDVNTTCPSELRVRNSAGTVIACRAACAIFPTDQYCCRNALASAEKCNPANWPVNYAKVFKDAEPFAYSYAFDDATSTLTCKKECNYRIVFGLSR